MKLTNPTKHTITVHLLHLAVLVSCGSVDFRSQDAPQGDKDNLDARRRDRAKKGGLEVGYGSMLVR